MIKAVVTGPTGQPMVVLGLSRANTERLLDNQPILVRLSDLSPDLPKLTIILIAGETEDDLAEDLRVLGPTRGTQ